MNYNIKRYIIIAVLAAFLSSALIQFLGTSTLTLDGLEFQVDTSLSNRGVTQIEIPPLGLVRAHTHPTPVHITIRLTNINLERLQNLLEEAPEQEEIFQRVEDNLRQEAHRYVTGLILLSAAGGLFAAFLLRSTNIYEYLAGVVVSVALVSMLLGATYKTYDANQFSNPEYEGVLKAAPWMISIAENSIAKIDTLSHKLQLIAQNFNELYEQIDNLQPVYPAEGNIKVLHVSDIHNNPAAIEFIGSMAELFAVNFIIDTGDISDFGTPLEGLLLDRITGLPAPYVFIAGNHDSPDIINRMNELGANVLVANGLVEISGLRIMGFHDPASETMEVTPPAPGELGEHVDSIREAVMAEVEASGRPIDIIAVHSPYVADPLAGLVPVFLYGHNHQFRVTEENGSVMVNCGTTGASGLATLQEAQRRPHSVMLLHFYKDNAETRLIAVDSIQVDSITSEFSMQRYLFADRDLDSNNFLEVQRTAKPTPLSIVQ